MRWIYHSLLLMMMIMVSGPVTWADDGDGTMTPTPRTTNTTTTSTPPAGGQCSWQGFMSAVGQQESGNNYQRTNGALYLGRFQFGEEALASIGWYGDDKIACGQCRGNQSAGRGCESGFVSNGGVRLCKNDYGGPPGFMGEATSGCNGGGSGFCIRTYQQYLENGPAQDRAFTLWMKYTHNATKRCHNRIGQQSCGCKVTMSGILAAAHLGGPGGGCAAANGTSRGDGGSSTCTYLCKFADYEIPPEVAGQNHPSGGQCKGCDSSKGSCQTKSTPNPPNGQPDGSGTPEPGEGQSTGAGTQAEEPIFGEPPHFENMAESLKRIWVGALQIMTAQMSANMMNQMLIIGSMFDAKEQLERQQLFQQMTAQAHKDYHPSEQMCEIGTMVRDLATTQARTKLHKMTVSNRLLTRELSSGDTLTQDGSISDVMSRLKNFRDNFCNPDDNGIGLVDLCKGKAAPKEWQNRDINFVATVETPLTLDVNFMDDKKTKEEEAVLSLITYLFMHKAPPNISLATIDRKEFEAPYQDLRSIIAMRGIARNSIASIVSQKSVGAEEDGKATPFIMALLKQMGLDETEIKKMIGENPSYFAQMEILTKTIYQDPTFIANLYDKPANVKRIRAAMQAIKLMQDRDIHEALLRREMLMSMILEVRLRQYQERVVNRVNGLLLSQ